MLFRVEQHAPVQFDAAFVGLFDARDALERHALAAAGGAQQAGHAVFRREAHVKAERPQLLLNIHKKAHLATAFFCRVSSMFTVSSTTVEMARFTITQKKAPRSSLVRQSW